MHVEVDAQRPGVEGHTSLDAHVQLAEDRRCAPSPARRSRACSAEVGVEERSRDGRARRAGDQAVARARLPVAAACSSRRGSGCASDRTRSGRHDRSPPLRAMPVHPHRDALGQRARRLGLRQRVGDPAVEVLRDARGAAGARGRRRGRGPCWRNDRCWRTGRSCRRTKKAVTDRSMASVKRRSTPSWYWSAQMQREVRVAERWSRNCGVGSW